MVRFFHDTEDETQIKSGQSEEKKLKGKIINVLSSSIHLLDFLFNITPFIASFCIGIFVYFRYVDNNPFLFLSLIFMVITMLISLGAYFILSNIDDSFHYQRVREIIYVLETANISMPDQKNFDKDSSLGMLWKAKCLDSDNELVIHNSHGLFEKGNS